MWDCHHTVSSLYSELCLMLLLFTCRWQSHASASLSSCRSRSLAQSLGATLLGSQTIHAESMPCPGRFQRKSGECLSEQTLYLHLKFMKTLLVANGYCVWVLTIIDKVLVDLLQYADHRCTLSVSCVTYLDVCFLLQVHGTSCHCAARGCPAVWLHLHWDVSMMFDKWFTDSLTWNLVYVN